MRAIMIAAVLAVSVTGYLTPATAQIQSACVSVYQDATRAYTKEEKESTELATSFSQHCEKNGSVKASSLNAGIDAVVQQIPFKFSAASKSSTQKLQEFCKVSSTLAYSSDAATVMSNVVVTDALRSFNQCVALEKKGLVITHDEQYPESVIFYGRFLDRTTNATLDTVSYDAKRVTCTSTNFNWLGTVDRIDDSRQKQIPSNFNITCRRIPNESAEAIKFPRVAIALSTSLGPYSVTLQEDQLNGYTLASEAKKQFDRVTAEKDALAGEKDALAKQVADLKAASERFDSYSVIMYHGNNLGFLAGLFTQNPRNFKIVNCPKNQAMFDAGLATACAAGYQGRHLRTFLDYNGGPCGNTFHELKCERR